MSENSPTSPRVNSAHLSKYPGRTVRLPCKVISKQGDSALVEASDGVQVQVKLTPASNIVDTYVEIVCQVVDAGSVKMYSCVNMGDDMDMKLVNDTIELTHDPKFSPMFF